MLYILEINNHTKVRNYFSVDIDSGKDFDYRARVSSNAFLFNTKGYNWKKDHTVFVGESEVEIQFDTYFEDNNPKVIHFNSIWEFYKHIGYDYKKKKYLKLEKLHWQCVSFGATDPIYKNIEDYRSKLEKAKKELCQLFESQFKT